MKYKVEGFNLGQLELPKHCHDQNVRQGRDVENQTTVRSIDKDRTGRKVRDKQTGLHLRRRSLLFRREAPHPLERGGKKDYELPRRKQCLRMLVNRP